MILDLLFLLFSLSILIAPFFFIIWFLRTLVLFRKAPKDAPEREEYMYKLKLTGILSAVTGAMMFIIISYWSYGIAHM